MKLGFICINIPGHLNPMTALARHLQDRNHDVVFLYSSNAAGLPFVPGPEKDHINESRPEVSQMQGDDAFEFACHQVLDQTQTILESLPAMVQANDIDALVLDTIQFYAELGAMQLDLPYIHVSSALHFDYTGYTPLSHLMVGLIRPPLRRWLETGRVSKSLLNYWGGATRGVRAYAKSAGLEIDWDDPGFTLSPLASITQTPSAFDFESSHWPSQFHHTGPFHDGKGRDEVNFPWERLTGEPLIYASMGTILNGRLDVFRTIVAALAKHKGLQLVLSVGDQVDPKQIGPAPSNAIIVKKAPQLELLKQTSVCITHAGLNTVLESLAQGVPQVAIPVTFEQPGVAARIAHKQTGIVTSLDKLTADQTADHLSTLLSEVVKDSTYRDNARQLQKAIAKANGLSVAADLIETTLGVTKKAGKT